MYFAKFLILSVRGLSEVLATFSALTHHQIAFAFIWGGAQLAGGIPKHCPSKNNWVSMPTKLEPVHVAPCSGNVQCKLKAFEVWDNVCGG
jgi:hypothetical protein